MQGAKEAFGNVSGYSILLNRAAFRGSSLTKAHPAGALAEPNWLRRADGCHSVAQSCPTLWDPMDCSLPDSSVREVYQARTLEWVALCLSRGSSWLRTECESPALAGGFLTTEPSGKPEPEYVAAEISKTLAGNLQPELLQCLKLYKS